MSNQFKVGDLVRHKADSASEIFFMTVHSFVDPESDSNNFNTIPSSWVNCTYFCESVKEFKSFCFHENELIK